MPGRNEPCPCGSGKKYKHCCLRADEERARAAQASGAGAGGGGGAGAHGGAQAMMLQQTGFSTPAELQAAMDEYGRFCEGLPDDADIPSFMEYLGRASAASGLFRGIRGEVADRDFESREELTEFLNQRMASANDSPREDFEGLSPARMHEILQTREMKQVPLLRYNRSLTSKDAATAPLVEATLWVLRYHADHGGSTRLTDRNNYPRALCRAYLARFDSSFREGMSVPNEKSLTTLYGAHDVLVANEWTDEFSRRSELTTEGVQMLTADSAVQVFRQAFESLILYVDWTDYLGDEYADTFPHFGFIQRAAVFSLYLLSRHPRGTIGDLFDRFARAFPEFVKPAKGDQRTIDWMEGIYAYLFIFRFCEPLGLVKVSREDSPSAAAAERPLLADRYRVTGLFENAFLWP